MFGVLAVLRRAARHHQVRDDDLNGLVVLVDDKKRQRAGSEELVGNPNEAGRREDSDSADSDYERATDECHGSQGVLRAGPNRLGIIGGFVTAFPLSLTGRV
jgi:hypothetical protein